MKNVFFIDYMGNKYKESKKQLIDYDFSKYKTVVECFGGSYGFSRFLYKYKNMKDTQYIVYDYDKNLIDFYHELQKDPIKYLDEYHDARAVLWKKYENVEGMIKYKTRDLIKYTPEFKKDFENMDISDCVRFWINHSINVACFRKLPIKNVDDDFIDMLSNIKFIHNTFNMEELEQYDKDTTLFYLDPPYLSSFNASYQTCGNNNIFIDIKDIIIDKNAIFVHSFDPLLEYLLKDYNKLSYPKSYAPSKGRVNHVIYSNCDIFDKLIKSNIKV